MGRDGEVTMETYFYDTPEEYYSNSLVEQENIIFEKFKIAHDKCKECGKQNKYKISSRGYVTLCPCAVRFFHKMSNDDTNMDFIHHETWYNAKKEIKGIGISITHKGYYGPNELVIGYSYNNHMIQYTRVPQNTEPSLQEIKDKLEELSKS